MSKECIMTHLLVLFQDPLVLLLFVFLFGNIMAQVPLHHALLRTVALYVLVRHQLSFPGILVFLCYVERADLRRPRRRKPRLRIFGQKKNHGNSPK